MRPRKKPRAPMPTVNRLSRMLLKQLDGLAPDDLNLAGLNPADLKPEGLTPEREMRCIRRCHRCGQTNEQQGRRVERCQQCQQCFAPFFFVPETPGFDKIAALYRPLEGFTVGWFDGPEECDPGRSSERLESRLHS